MGIILSIMGYFFEQCSKARLIGKKLSIIGWGLIHVTNHDPLSIWVTSYRYEHS